MYSLRNHDSIASALNRFKHWQKVLAKSCFMTIFSVHIMGCLWAMQVRCGLETGEETWLDFLSIGRPESELYHADNVVGVYICSLYWAVFTLTGIGYGDIVPVSITEYMLAASCMFCGSLIWAWVMASLVSIMSTMNQANNENTALLDCINGVLRSTDVPPKLSERLRQYVAKMSALKKEDAVSKIVKRLSPELKMNVIYMIFSSFILGVQWLKSIPYRTYFVVDITDAMKVVLRVPAEVIPMHDELVYIRSGLCVRGGLLLSKGDVWGQDFLLNNYSLRNHFQTVVLTFLHTLSIDKASMYEIVENYPAVKLLLRKSYLRLVLFRGMLFFVRQRKRIMAEMGVAHIDMQRLKTVQLSRTVSALVFDGGPPPAELTKEIHELSRGRVSKNHSGTKEALMAQGRLAKRVEDLEAMSTQLLEKAQMLASAVQSKVQGTVRPPEVKY
eukprot:TRINITY_DN18821_c0_g1_i2.p1 TRINITY_DN18821_c0_g1~~TRINITY_DN18821_c0_g1_i2.p1  ORF type:complete len:505 (+),score=49.64 TRINITY_DN18821_c0_g1_i2:186-1517(+)